MRLVKRFAVLIDHPVDFRDYLLFYDGDDLGGLQFYDILIQSRYNGFQVDHKKRYGRGHMADKIRGGHINRLRRDLIDDAGDNVGKFFFRVLLDDGISKPLWEF